MPESKTDRLTGFASVAAQYADTPLDLHSLLLRHPAASYFIRYSGDSLHSRGVYDGDLLLVDRSLDPQNNDLILFSQGDGFYVRFCRMENGTLFVVNARENGADIPLNQMPDAQFFGVVTSVIRQYRFARK